MARLQLSMVYDQVAAPAQQIPPINKPFKSVNLVPSTKMNLYPASVHAVVIKMPAIPETIP
jgi:hypothetical protein